MAITAPGARPKHYGKSIENGQLRYASASAATTADATADGGCLRKWYFQAAMGIRSPSTRAQEIGIELHGQVEHYLKTGEKTLGSLAMSGSHLIPPPGEDLGIELDITIDPEVESIARDAEMEGRWEDAAKIRAAYGLANAPLRIAGVPMVGYIDLIHARGTNQGASDIEDIQDPPNTVEVLDWKTTSDLKWIKTREALASSIQMTVYGAWVLKTVKNVEHVRLSHCYFVTKGSATPRKVTLRVLPAHIEKNLEHVAGVVRLMADAAKATSPNDVTPNTRSCDKFGGCPARSVCTAGMDDSLSRLIGPSAANAYTQRRSGEPVTAAAPGGGLFARMMAKKADATASTIQATTTPPNSAQYTAAITKAYGAPPGQSAAPPVDQAAEIARLKAEGRAAALALLPAGFAQAVARVESFGVGMPMLTGAAAVAYATLKDLQLKGQGFAGSGALAEANKGKGISDPALMAAIAEELAEIPPEPQAMGILPGDVPESDPVLASSPRTEESVVTQVAVQAAPTGSPVASALAAVVAQGEKTPRKRRTKAEMEAAKAAEASVAVPAPAPVAVEPPTPVAAEPAQIDNPTEMTQTSPGQFHIYIGCRPSCPYESLDPIIDAMCDDLAKTVGVTDVRLDEKGPLSFGKWRAVISAAIRENEIPPGHYVLDMVGDIADVATDALRRICQERGGILVRAR